MPSIDRSVLAIDDRCEVCGSTLLAEEVHYVLEERPAEPRELCAVLAGHAHCLPAGALSAPEAIAYIDSVEATVRGHALLTL
jgi:hypothetical protein